MEPRPDSIKTMLDGFHKEFARCFDLVQFKVVLLAEAMKHGQSQISYPSNCKPWSCIKVYYTHPVEPFILHTIKPQTGWMMFPFFCSQTVEPFVQRYTIVFGGLWPSPCVCFWKPHYKYVLVFKHFTIYIEVNTTNTAGNTSNFEENVQNMFLTSTKAN